MANEKRKEVFITGPPLKPLDPSISVADILFSALKENNADSVAQIEVETGRKLTYGQLLKDSLSVTQGLKAKGIGEGSIVAVVTFNSQEASIFTLATVFTGATVAPLDSGLTPDELGHFLKLIQPKIIFCDDGKTLNKIEQAHKVLPYTPVIVVAGAEKQSHITFQDLKQPIDVEFKPDIKNPEDHILFIVPTSGTTGLPKGVMVSDLYIRNFKYPLSKDPKLLLLVTSPLFWVSGIICLIRGIICGYTIVYLRGTVKENTLLSIIQDHKIDLWVTSPTALLGIVASPYKNAFDITSLKIVFAGGTSLSSESILQIQNDLFNNKIPVLQAYGMTEIGIISSCDDNSNKPGSSGLLRPGCKCKIENVATGESLGPGMKGEVCIKAPYIMKGYVNNPEAKAELFDKDGWIHTGDVGYYDEEGHLFVVDRMKEMIKYKSYHISPSELEDILRKHPAVKDALVVGVPHPTDGDHATAFIVPNKTVSEDELVQHVAERVSETKQLRGGVRFVEEIPCTPTGKPNRKILRDQLIARNNSSNTMEADCHTQCQNLSNLHLLAEYFK